MGRRPTRTDCTLRSPAAGRGRSSSGPTTAGRPGSRWATSSPTTALRVRISGTTGRRIRGSSPGSGIWSRRWTIRMWCMPESRTPGCSGRMTAAGTGRSCRRCAAMTRARRGSRARAGCACTRSCSTHPRRAGCSRRSRPLARSGPTTRARAGGRSTGGCSPRASRTRTPRSGTACTGWHAPGPAAGAVHAEALGRHAQRRRRRVLA